MTNNISENPLSFGGEKSPAPPGMTVDFSKTHAKIHALRSIGAPLIAAVFEVRALVPDDPSGAKQQGDAAAFAQLLESVGDITRHLSTTLPSPDGSARFNLAAAASTVVASHYRATAKLNFSDKAELLSAMVKKSMADAGDIFPDRPVSSYGEGFVQAKVLAGVGPVIAAIARYAFGRSEQDLIADVAPRLQKAAQSLSHQLLSADASLDEQRLMYGIALDVVGHLYAESHYLEADRLVEMSPEERAAYLSRNNNQIPLEPVWTKFDQFLSLLTTFVNYLSLPSGASSTDLSGW